MHTSASAGTLDTIDEIARSFVEAGKAPGIAYGLVHDGRVIHGGGAGLAVIDGRSSDAPADVPRVDSVFRIASMTKSFTAAAALLLRDEGLLDLDEPVATYVPAVAGIPMASDDAPPLTLRLLLTMSAGFPSDDPWADRQESLTVDAFDELLRSGPRFVAVPGTEYHYSNLGYAIVGRAISNICGQPLLSFITEQLLDPLGMSDTCFASDEVPGERLAIGYRKSSDEWLPEPFDRPGEFSAIGGLYSTVNDLAIWITGFIDATGATPGDHPLRASSRREMQQAHRLSDVGTSSVDGVAHAFSKGYGLGLTLERHTHWGDVIGHSGGYPGFGSNMRWHPASGYGVITLANSTYAGPAVAAASMLEAVLRGGAPRTRPPRPWPELATMRQAAERLIVDWDDELADDVFAMNMDLDEPRAERRANLRRIAEQVGEIDTTADDNEKHPSAADVDWTLTGTLGTARVELGLTPEHTPKIHTLDVTIAEVADEAAPH